MGRFLGPKHKMCRRVGERLCDSAKCPVMRRDYPAGAHGPKGRNTKPTTYAREVVEKQKAKRTYGILERQFANYYKRAIARVGDTSTFLGQLLERRLDNTVFRLLLARTRSQARQVVGHGHVLVNDKKINIPSYQVNVGDTITLKERSLKRDRFVAERSADTRERPGWVSFDASTNVGKVTSLPTANDFPKNINLKLIIEHYSR